MSFFTQCTTRRRKAPRPLPLWTIMRVMLALAVVLGFGLAHLGLRFKLHETRVETNRMQTQKTKLVSTVKALTSEIEALKEPEALLAYARGTLGMDYYVSSERETIRMPQEVHARYAMARAAIEDRMIAATRSELERQGEMWLEIVNERIDKMGMATTAVASEAREKITGGKKAEKAEKSEKPGATPKKASEKKSAGEAKAEVKSGN